MKIAHLADLHLGFRQFDRTSHGLNQRELDVALAWSHAVESIIAESPDVVLIAGDVFHAVRPPNHAIIALYQGLGRIRASLPLTPIIIIAGNHDSPRTMETAAILNLYRTLGVHVVIDGVQRFPIGDGVLVTAVPHRSAQLNVFPDTIARTNVLLLHAAVAGVTPGVEGVPLERFRGWDYVALGDYHVCHGVDLNVWYPGSLDYTSSNPWGELIDQRRLGWLAKGYLIVTLPGPLGAVVRRVELPTVRRFIDLPGFDAEGMAAAEVDLRIAQLVDDHAAQLGDAVVRLVITGASRELRAALDFAAIREYKAMAFHFQLDVRRAGRTTSTPQAVPMRRTLDEIVAVWLGERELPPDVDREQFVVEGLKAFRHDPYTGDPVP